jgi:uncharacterized protein YjbI with pentapeptide repeats
MILTKANLDNSRFERFCGNRVTGKKINSVGVCFVDSVLDVVDFSSSRMIRWICDRSRLDHVILDGVNLYDCEFRDCMIRNIAGLDSATIRDFITVRHGIDERKLDDAQGREWLRSFGKI